MKLTYEIAGVSVCFSGEYDFIAESLSGQFESRSENADYVISFRKVESFPELSGKCSSNLFSTACVDGGCERILFLNRLTNENNFMLEKSGDGCTLFFRDEAKLGTDSLWNYVDICGMMLERKRLLLHCSFVLYNGSAILFCGKSGAGKSTQADLWSKYKNADVINGDKALLYLKNGTVYASSLPMAGTSGICRNAEAPVRAIVSLGKSDSNKIKQLSGIESVMAVYGNSLFDAWRDGDALICLDLASGISAEVPVYSYQCVADESAVMTLDGCFE